MSVIPGGDWEYVATFDDGLGNRRTTDPYPATDLLVAMAKAATLRSQRYPTGRVVAVKEHHPMLDMIERSRA